MIGKVGRALGLSATGVAMTAIPASAHHEPPGAGTWGSLLHWTEHLAWVVLAVVVIAAVWMSIRGAVRFSRSHQA